MVNARPRIADKAGNVYVLITCTSPITAKKLLTGVSERIMKATNRTRQTTVARYCKDCGKNLSKDEVGLSQKLLGVGTENYFCVECFAKRYDCDADYLRDMIEEWKAQGCTLF